MAKCIKNRGLRVESGREGDALVEMALLRSMGAKGSVGIKLVNSAARMLCSNPGSTMF